MQWNLRLPRGFVVSVLTFVLLFTASPPVRAEEPPRPGPPAALDGRTVVQSEGAHAILVTVEGHQTDHCFHLLTNDTVPSFARSFPHAHVDYSGRELRIAAKNPDVVITLALRGVPARAESAAKGTVTRYTGYGLTYETEDATWRPVFRWLENRR